MFARLVAVTLALAPAAAFAAEDCPWLSAATAGKAILVDATQRAVEKNAVHANPDGMTASTTCRFRGANEGIGQFTVTVMEFSAEAGANAAYQRELKSQGTRAKVEPLAGLPSFASANPGASATFVLKGRKVLHVSHAYSKRVAAAVKKSPDKVLSTQEAAREAAAKL